MAGLIATVFAAAFAWVAFGAAEDARAQRRRDWIRHRAWVAQQEDKA
jgi:hypothetical protein